MKLWIVNVDTKTRVLLKFSSLETLCVDRRKAIEIAILLPIHVKFRSYVHASLAPSIFKGARQ